MSLVGIRRPKSKKGVISLAILLVVIIVAICGLTLMGNVSVKADTEGIVAKGTLEPTKTIKYNDIKSVVLRDNFDVGSKISGLSTFKAYAGKFHNSEFGNYTIYADNGCAYFGVNGPSFSVLVSQHFQSKWTIDFGVNGPFFSV